MLTHVEFRSDEFPPYDYEDKQVNPNIFGKRLAEFLRDGLRIQGFDVDEPFSEDWGWVLDIANPGFRLSIGCANYPEYPDGFLCLIEPYKPFVRRWFRKIDTRESVGKLQQAMDKILAGNVRIRDKKWWTHQEFNGPRR